jgi:hypothetical protein
MNELLVKIAALMAELHAQYGRGSVTASCYSAKYGPSFTFHDAGTYQEGTELLRSLGCDERTKQIVDESTNPWSSIAGKTTEGVEVSAYCSGLPPSCKMEVYKERIPKTQTVETAEFIEIERKRVVCGERAVH